MANTGLSVFDSTLQDTNSLLKDIEKEFGWEGRRDEAYDALRIVLQALRDRMTVDEAAEFAAQLPMLVKGIFYQEWDPSDTPKKIDREEFINDVRDKFVYSIDMSIEDLFQGVLLALTRFISKGEMQDVQSILPEKLKPLLDIY